MIQDRDICFQSACKDNLKQYWAKATGNAVENRSKPSVNITWARGESRNDVYTYSFRPPLLPNGKQLGLSGDGELWEDPIRIDWWVFRKTYLDSNIMTNSFITSRGFHSTVTACTILLVRRRCYWTAWRRQLRRLQLAKRCCINPHTREDNSKLYELVLDMWFQNYH